MLPTKLRFIYQSGFRGKDFLEIDQSETRIRRQTWPPWAMLVSDWSISKNLL
jgi:hypothetical protein